MVSIEVLSRTAADTADPPDLSLHLPLLVNRTGCPPQPRDAPSPAKRPSDLEVFRTFPSKIKELAFLLGLYLSL